MRLIILLSLLPFLGKTQKHDYVWLFGYDNHVEDSLFGGSFIDFNNDPITIGRRTQNLDFYISNASFSDSLGLLLIYTNGISIESDIGNTLTREEGLNPGEIADSFSDLGYPVNQGVLFLPGMPGVSSIKLLHTPSEILDNNQIHSPRLLLTTIEDSGKNSSPTVQLQNEIILNGQLTAGKLTATKHANGRDWWIPVRNISSNQYSFLLYEPDQVHFSHTQIIGDSIPSPGVGQAVFSPNGEKYVRFNVLDFYDEGNYLNIYDFDRCNGLLSAPVQFQIRDTIFHGGVAISPNSRFVYVSAGTFLFQYDLNANNIEESKDTVAIYDGFEAPFPTYFFHSQLAPDGKIYINTANGSRVLHIIHKPNLKGKACMVEQHGVTLPTYNSASLPNFPNYRLGPLEGSPCDTLSLTSTTPISEQEFDFQVYPNPASDFIYLSSEWDSPLGARSLHWRLIDALGRVVKRVRVNDSSLREKVDVSDLQPGVYFWEVDNCRKIATKGKLLILHKE